MNALHAALSRFGWELRPDLHDAGMTKHDEAHAGGDLVSSTLSEHVAVFTHSSHPGYIEVAGDNQFWWISTLAATPQDDGPYGEPLEGYVWIEVDGRPRSVWSAFLEGDEQPSRFTDGPLV